MTEWSEFLDSDNLLRDKLERDFRKEDVEWSDSDFIADFLIKACNQDIYAIADGLVAKGFTFESFLQMYKEVS